MGKFKLVQKDQVVKFKNFKVRRYYFYTKIILMLSFSLNIIFLYLLLNKYIV